MQRLVAPMPFAQTLTLLGITFQVQSANDSDTGTVRITPFGLTVDNSVQERVINGRVVGAEVSDLNVDGSPEVYVFVQSNSPHTQGSVVAMSANRGKSLTDVVLPALPPRLAKGYCGYDQFAVMEGVLGRRFAICSSLAPTNSPTKVRQIQYRLKRGEATWRLVVDKVVEF